MESLTQSLINEIQKVQPDIEEIKKLIFEGADVNTKLKNNNYTSLLHYACSHGKVNVVKCLVINGKANLEIVDAKTGLTPLLQTVCDAHKLQFNIDTSIDADTPSIPTEVNYLAKTIIIFLIKKGASLLARDLQKRTILHLCVEHCEDEDKMGGEGLAPQLLRTIIEDKDCIATEVVDTDVRDSYGRTPLYLACLHCKINAARVLLDEDAETEIPRFIVRHDEPVSMYDSHSIEPIGSAFYPLHVAISQNHLAMVELLISAFPYDDLQEEGYGDTPLHIATKYGYIEIVTLLLKEGADAMLYNNNHETCLHTTISYAISNKVDRSTIVQLLLENSVDLVTQLNGSQQRALDILQSSQHHLNNNNNNNNHLSCHMLDIVLAAEVFKQKQKINAWLSTAAIVSTWAILAGITWYHIVRK